MQCFPFSNVKFYGRPTNLHYAGLLTYNLKYVLTYFNNKKQSNFIKGYGSPHISVNSYKQFRELVYRYTQETAQNTLKKEYSQEYLKNSFSEINNYLNQLFQLIDPNKEGFFSVEMHEAVFDSFLYKENWYELMYKELLTIFKYTKWYFKDDKDEESKLTSLSKNTETQVHLEIKAGILNLISEPKRYKIFKKDYNPNDKREDDRTAKIIGLSNLKGKFIVDYQHITGSSETGKTEGEADFAIYDKENTKITIGEAINWSGYDKNLKKHINKLQVNYNSTRLPFLIFLIYYESKAEKFKYYLNSEGQQLTS